MATPPPWQAVSILSVESVASNGKTSISSLTIEFSFSESDNIVGRNKFTSFLPFCSESIDVPGSESSILLFLGSIGSGFVGVLFMA